MAIRRITISVPDNLAEQTKKAASDQPVWHWVQEALEEHLTDEELSHPWEEFYTDVQPRPGSDQTGGRDVRATHHADRRAQGVTVEVTRRVVKTR